MNNNEIKDFLKKIILKSKGELPWQEITYPNLKFSLKEKSKYCYDFLINHIKQIQFNKGLDIERIISSENGTVIKASIFKSEERKEVVKKEIADFVAKSIKDAAIGRLDTNTMQEAMQLDQELLKTYKIRYPELDEKLLFDKKSEEIYSLTMSIHLSKEIDANNAVKSLIERVDSEGTTIIYDVLKDPLDIAEAVIKLARETQEKFFMYHPEQRNK